MKSSFALDPALEPLVELLQEELHASGISPPPALEPGSVAAFSRWYLQVLLLLDKHAAGSEPMSRVEVEMMCRCTLSARNLGEAMTLVGQYSEMLHPRAGKQELSTDGDVARFTLDSLRVERSVASDLADIAGLFAFGQLFEWLVGGSLALRQVGIGPVSRDDLLPFLRLFNAPVLVGSDVYSLEYDLASLERPIVAASGEFEDFFEVFPCGFFQIRRALLNRQVAALLSAAIRQSLPLPSLRQVASTLALSPSTFRRRLLTEGTHYREIKEHCLREVAEDLLKETEISVGQLAVRLGFHDTDTFRNAFRRWAGESPSAWREKAAG